MRRPFLTYLHLALMTALLAGCTLSMEDYVIEEEMSRGFDEPFTEVTDIGTFTYQYQEGVRPITKKVLDYVLGVESDSIVYYAENCPSEWLPKVGGYVSCGCSRKIPNGLCNRVLSVQHQDGHYKVVTTKAKTDEVFKELDIDVTFEYQAPNLTDSTLTENPLLEKQDSTIIDWGMIEGGAATRAFTPTPTRGEEDNEDADKDKEKDKDVESEDEEKDMKTIEWPIKIDFPVPGETFKAYIEGKYSHVVRKLVHYKARKENNLCESWEEDHSYTTWEINAGVYVDVKEQIIDDNVFKVQDLLKKLTKKSVDDLKKPVPLLEIAPIKIPIGGPTALWFVADFTMNINLVVRGYGQATWTTYQPVKRIGKIEEDGKEDVKIDEISKEGYTTCTQINVCGEVEVGVEFTISAGVQHSTGVGIMFDATFSTGFTIGKTMQLPFDTGKHYVYDSSNNQVMAAPEKSVYYKSDFQITWSLDFQGAVKFVISPFGFELFSAKVPFPKINIAKKTWDFGLTYDQKKSNLKDYEMEEAEVVGLYDVMLTPKYEYSSLGIDISLSSQNHYPRLRFYDTKHEKFFDLLPEDYHTRENTLEKGKTYKFRIKKDDALRRLGEKYTCYAVPVYCKESSTTSKTVILSDYEQTIGSLVSPTLSFKSIEQVFGIAVTNMNNPQMVLKRMGLNNTDPYYWSDMTCYSFRTRIDLTQADAIELWGISIGIYRASNHKLLSANNYTVADRSKNQSIRAGVYTIRNEFLSQYNEWNFDYDNHFNDKLYVTVTPYLYYKGDVQHLERKYYDTKTLYLEGGMEGEENLLDYETYSDPSGTDVK